MNEVAIRQDSNPFSAPISVEGAATGGELGVVAREQSEIQAAIVSAKKFPRNEAAAFTKVVRSFQRKGCAESALYSFPRGGQTVTGPSVDLARECARCWGNIRHGIRIVSNDGGDFHIRGYALDLETNDYCEAEAKFSKKIQRKNKQTGATQWVDADERDARELVSKHGAILVRNSILQILPPDLVDAAVEAAVQTMRAAAAGDLKANKADTIKALCLAFDEIGVSAAMLERRFGHELGLMTEGELTELRAAFKAIKDGHARREEYFDFLKPSSSAETDELTQKITRRGSKE